MPSLIAHSFKLFSKMYIRHNPKSQASLVAHLRRSMNHSPLPVLLPAGVRAEPWQDGPLGGDRLVVDKPEQVLLYLHGGGYVCGRTKTYFNMCSRLARELNAEVLLPDYRLAPEHPFPAAIEDCVAAYEYLLRKGWRADQITLAGDSAGGGLALGTLLCLRDNARPMPRCAVLISPYADVHVSNSSIRGNDATDFMLGANMLEVGRNVYARTPLDAAHPYASPALGDYKGLPPLFITVCDHECLRDDAYAVEARARQAGVPVTLLSRPDLFHVWPIFAPFLPEAREELPRMANFIRGAGRSGRGNGVPNAGATAAPVRPAAGTASAAQAAAAKPAPASARPVTASAKPASTAAQAAPATAGKPSRKSGAAPSTPGDAASRKTGTAVAGKKPRTAAPAPKKKGANTAADQKEDRKGGKKTGAGNGQKAGKAPAKPRPRSLEKPVKADTVNTAPRGKARKAG